MNTPRIAVTVLAIILVTLAVFHLNRENTVRRAAFDIGSGSIKYIVADVDPETHKIIRIVDQASRKADFRESLARTPDRRISNAVAAESTNIMRELINKAGQLGATEFAAVGTQVFHQASNGMEYFRRLRDTLGIPASMITQEQQAMLGFLATLQYFDVPPADLVVWDIGAASSQMVIELQSGEHISYLGDLASVNFKNYIIETLQRKNPASTQSPNPLSLEEMQQALEYAARQARKTVPEAIRERIARPDTRIMGIGPVHAVSILGQVGKELGEDYTQQEVLEALEKRVGMTDAAVGGSYANVQISNLILVLGYMKGLDIERVTPARINLADGLLVADELWR